MALVPAVAALQFTVLGAILGYVGYRRLVPEVRRLRGDPLSVREATTVDRPVEFRGTVEPEDHYVEAPFTGTHCVAFEYEAEEYVSSGQHSHWDTLASGSQSLPFRLADDTGSILVDPAGGELTLQSGWSEEVGADETAEGRVREFLERLEVEPGEGSEFAVGPISVGTGDRRRYSEDRLDVGETVSVYGRPAYDADAGGEWGSDAVDAAVRATDDEPFVVADSPSVPLVRRSTLLGTGALVAGLALVAVGLAAAAVALGAL